MSGLRRGFLLLIAAAALASPAQAAERRETVVVTLEAPPLAAAVAQSRALSASAKRARLDLRTPTSRSYLRSLAAARRSLEARIERAIPSAKLGWRYEIVVNGFSLTLPRSQLARLERLPGVAKVWPSTRYHSLLDRSAPLIGAPTLWNADLSAAGGGVKIAVLDDGIEPGHAFFSGAGYAPPPGYPKGDTAYTNAKLIVARAFPPRTPSWRHAAKPFDPELSAHGTHVAGIAAGNFGTVAVDGRTLAGIAPRAFLGNYKVLTIPTDADVGLDGNAPEITAGIEAAVRDGMDVINLSLGEPEVEPTRDLVTAALDAAAQAGVVPVLAAGNDFPEFGRGSVGSPGSAARAITVAAATKGRAIADFSSSGPTPLSLRVKPEVSAPGASILSSVPTPDGTWESFSGTSMAAPHVAGSVALLRQRHPEWTTAQVKSALALTGDTIAATSALRQGGGIVNLPRALNPLVFADPVSVSFGLVRSGAVPRTVALSDAGGGAGDWQVTLEQQSLPAGAAIAVPPTVAVPGTLALTLTPGSTPGDATGWLVLTRGTDVRRIAYWGRVLGPAMLPAPTSVLRTTGTYTGTTRGRPAGVSQYAFPEGGQFSSAALPGPEQVFRVVVTRPLANFGVAVLAGNVTPRIVRAGEPNQLVGYTALPLNLNPYLRSFFRPAPTAAAVLVEPGAYDVVFDSASAAAAGSFRFRFWLDDATPPTVRLERRRVAVGARIRVRITDAGAGVDPNNLLVTLGGNDVAASFEPGKGLLTIRPGTRRRGNHRLAVQASDWQETKNNENQPRILPNTTRFSAVVRIG